jgi:hypothetical protein
MTKNEIKSLKKMTQELVEANGEKVKGLIIFTDVNSNGQFVVGVMGKFPKKEVSVLSDSYAPTLELAESNLLKEVARAHKIMCG